MKKYKFITIESMGMGEFIILNNKSNKPIGGISYYGPWSQYVFDADENSVWSADCLEDVIDFIKNKLPKATA